MVVWLRFLFLFHLLMVQGLRWSHVAHPWWLGAVTLLIIGWTLLVNRLYLVERMWSRGVLALDMAVTLATIAVSPFILGDTLAVDKVTVGGYWIFAAPMAVAVWGGLVPGLVAGFIVGLAAWAVSPALSVSALAPDMAVVVASAAVGYLMQALRQALAERDREQRHVAQMAERERLSRIVHDGTLQVLALMAREGPSLGAEGERLARLARAQEINLRRLLQDRAPGQPLGDAAEVDLTEVLDDFQSDSVTVSVMAGGLYLPAETAAELEMIVGEMLSNVRRHAGEGAHAWILLDHEAGALVLYFRDNGVGMPPGRLEEALEEGRMGVSESIRGRMHTLGGSAELTSRPGNGVEWTLRLPV